MNKKKFDFKKLIFDFPEQFKKALEISKDFKKIKRKFENIIICGMGGSCFPANLLSLFDFQIPIFLHRDYSLPYFANKKSLVICVSDSGDTEETLFAYQEALKKNLFIISITSGGKLKKLSIKNKIPFILIPNSSLPPRYTTGYIFTFLVKIISQLKVSENDKKISQEILKDLESLEEKLNKKIFLLEKNGRGIASKLKNKIPLIYTSSRFKILARILKIKINENAKEPAFWNFFSELNHNEMSFFESASMKKFYFFFLKDKNENPRILKRMNLTLKIIKKNKGKILEIEIKGKNLVEKIFSTLLLGDFISYYLALLYKRDPFSTKLQEDFKKMLLNLI